jgi:hypothetical protein
VQNFVVRRGGFEACETSIAGYETAESKCAYTNNRLDFIYFCSLLVTCEHGRMPTCKGISDPHCNCNVGSNFLVWISEIHELHPQKHAQQQGNISWSIQYWEGALTPSSGQIAETWGKLSANGKTDDPGTSPAKTICATSCQLDDQMRSKSRQTIPSTCRPTASPLLAKSGAFNRATC